MIVKGSYEKAGDVPQEFKDSFKEVDGKFVFTGSIDVKTQEDVDKVLGAKKHIDTELSETKELLKVETQKAVDVQNKLDLANIKIQDGAVPDDKLQELVETRVKVATEQLTTQLAEANEKNQGFQDTIHGSEKAEFIGGLLDNFSADVKFDAEDILNSSFKRQADGSYLTVKTKDFEEGLTSELAIPKILERRTNWQKQNQGDGAGGGGNAQPKEGRAKFDELLKKQQGGEKLDRNESIELSTLANQLKNEE